jgi:hypothetical protein
MLNEKQKFKQKIKMILKKKDKILDMKNAIKV